MDRDEFDVAAYAKGVVDAQHRVAAASVEYVELRHRTIMRALAKAYENALKYPNTHIPTELHVMLGAVAATVKQYPA